MEDEIVVGGKTLSDWDDEWIPLKGGYETRHPEYRHRLGLHRAIRGGDVMYIGVATERPGGLGKRLADFVRKSASARDHYGAKMIREHRRDLTLEVLCTGSDREAGDIAEKLKPAMIALHAPPWNVRRKTKPRNAKP